MGSVCLVTNRVKLRNGNSPITAGKKETAQQRNGNGPGFPVPSGFPRAADVAVSDLHPNVVWIVFSKAVRLKGFSRRVMPRFNISRSAISSPVYPDMYTTFSVG